MGVWGLGRPDRELGGEVIVRGGGVCSNWAGWGPGVLLYMVTLTSEKEKKKKKKRTPTQKGSWWLTGLKNKKQSL